MVAVGVNIYSSETEIPPATMGLEDAFPFGKASWQVLCWFRGVYLTEKEHLES